MLEACETRLRESKVGRSAMEMISLLRSSDSVGKGREGEVGVEELEELEGGVWCISCDFGGTDKERRLTGSADILSIGYAPQLLESDVRIVRPIMMDESAVNPSTRKDAWEQNALGGLFTPANPVWRFPLSAPCLASRV